MNLTELIVCIATAESNQNAILIDSKEGQITTHCNRNIAFEVVLLGFLTSKVFN